MQVDCSYLVGAQVFHNLTQVLGENLCKNSASGQVEMRKRC